MPACCSTKACLVYACDNVVFNDIHSEKKNIQSQQKQ